MKVKVLGGPHDGAVADIPVGMGENQMFLIEKVQYFVHTPRDKPRRLIYYKSSQDS